MEAQELIDTLVRYRAMEKRIAYLERFIPKMEQKLERLREEARQAAGAAPALTGMPGSGRPGDPTGQMAAGLADGSWNGPIRDCCGQLIALSLEKARLTARLALADCALARLEDEERFLITERLVEKRAWKEMPDLYAAAFGLWPAERTLRRRMRAALAALDARCGEMKEIPAAAGQ